MSEVHFENGGRVQIGALPSDRPADAPPIACVCGQRLVGGDGFFVEVDAMEHHLPVPWGVGLTFVCAKCLVAALYPRNLLAARRAWTPDVEAGQIWTDNLSEQTWPCRITVRRVARDGSWADIRVRTFLGVQWGKRMRLPFPLPWRRLA